jgi:sterol desaturase/sphingolipid hydroxylase (fatty acid hydroxylase superfamily)
MEFQIPEFVKDYLWNYDMWGFVGIFICGSFELLAPSGQKKKYFRPELFSDLFLWTLLVDAGFHDFTEDGLINQGYNFLGKFFPGYTPIDLQGKSIWLQFLVFYLIYETMEYFLHRALHNFKAGWVFHKLHHSSKHIDWYSEARDHPFHIIFSNLLFWLPIIFIFSFDNLPVFIFMVYLRIYGMFVHTDVNWRLPAPFSWFIASPFLHRWHHSKDLDGKCNYANNFILLDRIFGTYHAPKEHCTNFGFQGEENYPENFFLRLIHPFDVIFIKTLKKFKLIKNQASANSKI